MQPPEQGHQFQEMSIRDLLQDERGYIWAASLNGLLKYDGYQLEIIQYDAANPSGLMHNFVTDLQTDPTEPYTWIASYGGGLHRLDIRRNKLESVLSKDNASKIVVLNCITFDHDGFLWTGGVGFLCKMNRHTLEYEQVFIGENKENQPDVLAIQPAGEDAVWIGTTEGIYEINTKTNRQTVFPETQGKAVSFFYQNNRQNILARVGNELFFYHIPSPGGYKTWSFREAPFQYINTLLEVADDVYWLGTNQGLWQWKPGDGGLRQVLLFDPVREKSPVLEISAIFRDQAGHWWIGTKSSGLWQISPSYFYSLPKRNDPVFKLRHPTVTNIFLSEDQLLWIGTLDGLQLYDLVKQREIIPRANREIALFRNRITFVFKDSKGQHWVGVYGGGYYLIPSVQDFIYHGKFEQYNITDKEGNIQAPNAAMRMMEDKHGNLWVGTFGSSIHIRRPKYNDVMEIKEVPGENESFGAITISSIVTDPSGTIWVGTYDRGLFRYLTPDSVIPHNRFEHFNFEPGNANSLSHDVVLSIYPDPKGRLWIGTYSGGLNCFDPENNHWQRYSSKDGLNAGPIYSILPDENGNIWLSSDYGLSQFRINENRFVNYSKQNGMPFDRHYFFSAFRDDTSGRLFFGGIGGMYDFDPDDLDETAPAPVCRITKFKLFNEEVPVTTEGILQKDINYAGLIKLNYDQSVIGFDLSVLSFRNPEKRQYAYKMEGFDPDWNYVGGKNEITYTNLDPGTYDFYYKGADYRGVWSEEMKLKIEILPPPWKTWWAYLSYASLLATAILFFYKYQLNRRLEHAEALRLRELDAFKTRLYTNITHEFRTPLTVISGMADQVRENPREWFSEGLTMIKRNSSRLLELVNQMLDLSKLESGKMPLHLRQADVVNYLKYLIESFHSFAESRGVQLHFLSDLDALTMDFDAEKMQQVTTNLLSNAVKFTPAGGHAYVSVSKEHDFDKTPFLLLKIRDTGTGIAEDKLPHIFDRFYQADNSDTRHAEGSGIGLALVKELVKLMDGHIEAKSEPGQGTEFFIRLPIRNGAEKELPGKQQSTAEIIAPEPAVVAAVPFPEMEIQPVSEGKPLVLLAEDNADVVAYLASCLAGDYRLSVAKNGQECVDIALEIIPDLIVSDVMMPHRDGFEVCKILKNDERTSHVPIVMLTARADIESRLAGLERGADAYLAKPFHKQELLVEIKKLLELRQKLQAHYRLVAGLTDTTEKEKAQPAAPEEEDYFVKKARRVVEAHLDDCDFTVEQFCLEMKISNAHLHRKLSALTGFSATRFIRYIRLNKAKELLQNPALSITAVAFDTGFNDPSYFGRVFKQEFGVTPLEWRERNKLTPTPP